jgi:hypothetical protein
LFLNDERDFNIDNTYLIILAFGVICLFILCDYHELNGLYKYFFAITTHLLSELHLTYPYGQNCREINNLNFYEAFNEKSANLFKAGKHKNYRFVKDASYSKLICNFVSF